MRFAEVEITSGNTPSGDDEDSWRGEDPIFDEMMDMMDADERRIATFVDLDPEDPDLQTLMSVAVDARLELRVHLPEGSSAYHAYWRLDMLRQLNCPIEEVLTGLEERDVRYLKFLNCVYLWQVLGLSGISSDRVRALVLEECEGLNRRRPEGVSRFGLRMDLTPFRGRLAQ